MSEEHEGYIGGDAYVPVFEAAATQPRQLQSQDNTPLAPGSTEEDGFDNLQVRLALRRRPAQQNGSDLVLLQPS